MELLPELLAHIFSLLTSKDRSIICSVSSIFEKLAIKVSQSKSSYPYLYDYKEPNINLECGIIKRIIYDGDYHLIVRLKYPKLINLHDSCRSKHLDLVNLCIDLKINIVLDPNYKKIELIKNAREVELNALHVELDALQGNLEENLNIPQVEFNENLNALQVEFNENLNSSEDPFPDIDPNYHWNLGLHIACSTGDNEIVHRMIEMGADDWYQGFIGACYGGNIDLINLMITMGCSSLTDIDEYWNDGLDYACRGGHLEVVEMMINKGADDWSSGLHNAAMCGQKKLIDLMVAKGASLYFGMAGACSGKSVQIIQYIEQLMDKNQMEIDWKCAFHWACTNGSKKIVSYIIDKVYDPFTGEGENVLYHGLCCACEEGHLGIVRLLMGYFPKVYNFYGRLLFSACLNKHVQITKYICDLILSSDNKIEKCEWCNKTIKEHNVLL